MPIVSPIEETPIPQTLLTQKKKIGIVYPLELGFVLDASGSMQDSVQFVIDGFNHLLEEQKQLADNVSTTLVRFANAGTIVYNNIPIIELPELSRMTYCPNGGTALLDGVGLALDEIGRRFDSYTQYLPRVLIAILSDGGENSSRLKSLAKITEEIQFRMFEDDWQFIYLAIGGQAENYAYRLGIPQTHVLQLDADDLLEAWRRLSRTVHAYRLGHTDFLRLTDN